MSTERTERAYRSNLNNGTPLLVVYREEREFVLTEGSKRRPKRRQNLIWPEPAQVKSDSAGAEDGTPRPVDLRERSDLKKEKPPKGFERSDKRASVICSPGRRRRTESRLLEHAKRSGTRRACGGRAAETTGGESFGRSVRRSNDSPKGARPEPTGGEPTLRAA